MDRINVEQSGPMPHRFMVTLVSQDAENGSWTHNSMRLAHFNIKSKEVDIDCELLSKRLELDFVNKHYSRLVERPTATCAMT